MYHDELARSGKRLFLVRGAYIYLVIAGATAIAWTRRDPGPFSSAAADLAWIWVAIAVAGAGALIRIVTSGFAAFGTSGRTKLAPEAAELNTTGPYSLVRNPLYVGRIVNYTGIAMLSGSGVYPAIVFLLSIFVYERIAIFEEEFLRNTFGEAHSAWARDVPALLPRLSGWVPPKNGFWWKRMIWREKQKVFLLATAVFLCWFARLNFDLDTAVAANREAVWAYAIIAAAFLFSEVLRLSGYFRDLR